MGNFLVWVIWILAALACISTGIAVISFTKNSWSNKTGQLVQPAEVKAERAKL